MSYDFLGCPRYRVKLYALRSHTNTASNTKVLRYIQFKTASNLEFHDFKIFLKQKCAHGYKINSKLPLYLAYDLSIMSQYGKDVKDVSFVDVYFKSLSDLANIKMRWKIKIFE